MKYIIVIALIFGLSACSLFTPKKAPEVVASCFSDGEDQTKMCKSQRTDEDNRIVVTRCIGTQNREASPALRGKCAEKICSEGSNSDCQVKGEMRVLAQYAELVTSNMFGDGDGESAAPAAKKHTAKEKKLKAKMAKAAAASAPVPESAAESAASVEVDTDPSVVLAPLPEKKVAVEPTPAPAPKKEMEEASQPPQMSIALKPAKPLKSAKKKAASAASRAVAAAKSDEGFKKVCVAKNDSDAPEILRGKCATRSCSSSGKCSYKGRKEMFDYVAKSE